MFPNKATAGKMISKRLASLESHLERENPVLLDVVKSFQELDQVGYRLHLLDNEESYATRIPWWPLVSVLGTFSAGKSTFINDYLGESLQATGNQAVDDKFTVTCFSRQDGFHVLPGLALDADPRFPFYKISQEIDKVAAGEGRRIDAYLQLKTCPSERLRGKILIDSPGFDADEQRTSTLRITDHIIDLSDLVLVFFDARHPEPGSMKDTLDHLVSRTINRPDSNKFLFILNQMDTAAREDNPEQIVAAWQRALAQRGLTAGRFYAIYNDAASVPIDDPERRRRFESKRDHDLEEIFQRIRQVEVERAYRIVGALEQSARDILDRDIPKLEQLLRRWRKRSLIGDGVFVVLLTALLVAASHGLGEWNGLSYQAGWWDSVSTSSWLAGLVAGVLLAALVAGHFWILQRVARGLLSDVQKQNCPVAAAWAKAFARSTRPFRSLWQSRPAGWNKTRRAALLGLFDKSHDYVQQLNDRFTNPSGVQIDPVIEPVEEKSMDLSGISGMEEAEPSMPTFVVTPDQGEVAEAPDLIDTDSARPNRVDV